MDGFKGTPAEIERQWYEKVYVGRGDRMPQLTLRAVLMGTVLGGVLSLTNLYVGLKAGWLFGVAITAAMPGPTGLIPFQTEVMRRGQMTSTLLHRRPKMLPKYMP